jgi:hypothetical protein
MNAFLSLFFVMFKYLRMLLLVVDLSQNMALTVVHMSQEIAETSDIVGNV